jgi:hypothetical protein
MIDPRNCNAEHRIPRVAGEQEVETETATGSNRSLARRNQDSSLNPVAEMVLKRRFSKSEKLPTRSKKEHPRAVANPPKLPTTSL